jgi:hypothetical protein
MLQSNRVNLVSRVDDRALVDNRVDLAAVASQVVKADLVAEASAVDRVDLAVAALAADRAAE